VHRSERVTPSSMTTPGEIGPFALSATDLYRRGLTPVPCPSNNGKSVKGAVRGHGSWRRRPPTEWLDKMIRDWPNANVGIVTGLSGVTVVDVDRPGALAHTLIARCGNTPLKTRTPSGGTHLWYRGAGERCGSLRHEGMNVDIKGQAASSWSRHQSDPKANMLANAMCLSRALGTISLTFRRLSQAAWHPLPRVSMVRKS